MPVARAAPHTLPHRTTSAWVLAALCAGGLFALFPYVPGMVGAPVLYVLAAPLHRRLRGRLGARPAAALLTLGILFLLLLPAAWIVSTGVAEAMDALRAFQRSDLLARLSVARAGGIDLRQHVSNAAGTLVGWLSGRAVSLVGSATRTALNAMVALFGLYYLLADGSGAWRGLRRLLPVPEATRRRVAARFVEVSEAMLLGTLLTAALQGAIVGIAFALVGLRGAVLWGLVTACASVFPVFGSALVWLPAAGLLALEHRYGAMAVMLVLGGGLAANLDNVVRLVVYRRVSGIHPMVTLLGALGGVHVFGMAGVLIGPLALSYLAQLTDLHREKPVDAEPSVAIDEKPEEADASTTKAARRVAARPA